MENNELTTLTDPILQVEKGISSIKDQMLAIVKENKQELYESLANGQNILANIAVSGMDDYMDAQAAEYIKSTKTVLKSISERRKPITQVFDMVKKGFTTMEGMLSTKGDSVVAELQKKRDEYAAYKLEFARKAEAERQRKAREKVAREQLAQDVRSVCNMILSNTLQHDLGIMNNSFALLTLDNKDKVKEAIANWNTKLNLIEQFEKLKPYYNNEDISDVDAAKIIGDTLADVSKPIIKTYEDKIVELRDELLLHYDSKVSELVEQKRLADEAIRREAEAKAIADEKARQDAIIAAKKAEEERKAREEAIRKAEEERQAELEAQIRQEAEARAEEEKIKAAQLEAQKLFDSTSDGIQESAPKVKVTKTLIVNTTDGWLDVFRLWWTHCATPESIAKKLEFARKDVEKLANKTDEYFKVVGSVWEENVKAK